MAAIPYMRMYWADYDADTAHLTAMQHGIYLLLIKNYWQRGGSLPDDEVRLSRIAKVNLKDWRRNEAVIREFFTVEENLWHHSRIASELSHVAAKSLKSKEAALANAKRTQSKRSADAERTLTYTDTDTDKTLAKANGASAGSDEVFWGNAKAYLQSESRNPGAMIGKWVRDYGKEATAAALTRAQLERPVEKIPFIEGCFKRVRAQPAVPL